MGRLFTFLTLMGREEIEADENGEPWKEKFYSAHMKCALLELAKRRKNGQMGPKAKFTFLMGLNTNDDGSVKVSSCANTAIGEDDGGRRLSEAQMKRFSFMWSSVYGDGK